MISLGRAKNLLSKTNLYSNILIISEKVHVKVQRLLLKEGLNTMVYLRNQPVVKQKKTHKIQVVDDDVSLPTAATESSVISPLRQLLDGT